MHLVADEDMAAALVVDLSVVDVATLEGDSQARQLLSPTHLKEHPQDLKHYAKARLHEEEAGSPEVVLHPSTLAQH